MSARERELQVELDTARAEIARLNELLNAAGHGLAAALLDAQRLKLAMSSSGMSNAEARVFLEGKPSRWGG